MKTKTGDNTRTDDALQTFDIVVLGGGITGTAMALALADKIDGKLALLDAGSLTAAADTPAPEDFDLHSYDVRVCALTAASRQFLEQLDVWEAVARQRACPYSDMHIQDAEGTGQIHFSARDLAVDSLGYIVENSLLRQALLQRLEQTPVHRLSGQKVQQIDTWGEQEPDRPEHSVRLTLDNGSQLATRLLIAADGAASRSRSQVGIVTREWDYLHRALVATVRLEHSHQNTAWQIFRDTGPLAFLPLVDTPGGHTCCSIVWSLLPDEARRIMALDDDAFRLELARCIEHRFGRIVDTGQRFCHPLRQLHACRYHRNRVVVVGDAAHSIHPLAGQGANLGLLDVAQLADTLDRACQRGEDFSSPRVLDRYERARKGHNLAMAGLMESLQHLFHNNRPLVRWLRNSGLNITDGLPALKRPMARWAMGLDWK